MTAGAADGNVAIVPANAASCQRSSCNPGSPSTTSQQTSAPTGYAFRPAAGTREPDSTSGLVAFLDGEPVGWCAVEPRTAYPGLVRHNRVPWQGRDESKSDDSVWAVTCLFTRAGFRKRGIGRALARAAVDFARERGARALEGYPMNTKNAIPEELHVATEGVFAEAGLTEVSRPTLRRTVMRIDF